MCEANTLCMCIPSYCRICDQFKQANQKFCFLRTTKRLKERDFGFKTASEAISKHLFLKTFFDICLPCNPTNFPILMQNPSVPQSFVIVSHRKKKAYSSIWFSKLFYLKCTLATFLSTPTSSWRVKSHITIKFWQTTNRRKGYILCSLRTSWI